jgi:hypothetical protein
MPAFIKISDQEILSLKSRILIRARPYNGKLLDVPTLEESGLLPFYKIEVSQRNVYVSEPYKKSGYVAFVGYVEDGGNIIARTFFYSRSEGIARVLRRYKFTEIITEEGEKQDKVTWNDKGYSEKSIALATPLQKGLAEILNLYAPTELRKMSGNIFYGTTYDISVDDDYSKEVEKNPIKLSGNFYSEDKKSLVPPEKMVFTEDGNSPDFKTLVDSYKVHLEYYGITKVASYKSKDTKFIYVLNTDNKGRTWICQVDNLSEITSMGIRRSWVDSGNLTTPAWEYLIGEIDQTGGYGDESNRLKSYVDMYKNYIGKIPVVKEYESLFKPSV